MKKLPFVISALALATTIFALSPVLVKSQQSAPAWSEVVQNMPDPDQIKSIEASFVMESYVNDQVYKSSVEDYNKSRPKEASLPDEQVTYPWVRNPNGVASYRMLVQGEQFRCERTRLYPLNTKSPVLDYVLYDGEKLYQFEGQFFHGNVTALQPTPGFFQDYQSINHLGWPSYVETFKENKDIKMNYIGDEQTSDGRCLKYSFKFDNENSALRVSLCQQKSYAFKRLESYVFSDSKRENGTAVVYTAEKIEKGAAGLFFPRESQIDVYKISNGKMYWSQTTKCFFSLVDFNPQSKVGLFDIHFPPGTLIMNELDSPGESNVEGGRVSSSINSVEKRINPNPYFADGTEVPSM